MHPNPNPNVVPGRQHLETVDALSCSQISFEGKRLHGQADKHYTSKVRRFGVRSALRWAAISPHQRLSDIFVPGKTHAILRSGVTDGCEEWAILHNKLLV